MWVCGAVVADVAVAIVLMSLPSSGWWRREI